MTGGLDFFFYTRRTYIHIFQYFTGFLPKARTQVAGIISCFQAHTYWPRNPNVILVSKNCYVLQSVVVERGCRRWESICLGHVVHIFFQDMLPLLHPPTTDVWWDGDFSWTLLVTSHWVNLRGGVGVKPSLG